jgi:hypothetical protein
VGDVYSGNVAASGFTSLGLIDWRRLAVCAVDDEDTLGRLVVGTLWSRAAPKLGLRLSVDAPDSRPTEVIPSGGTIFELKRLLLTLRLDIARKRDAS